MIQKGCEDELEKRNGAESGEGCGVNGGLYLIDMTTCREEEIMDGREK